jgi:hypothetical protein
LLASQGSKGKNRNSLACLRNAGSYFAVTYCTMLFVQTSSNIHTFCLWSEYVMNAFNCKGFPCVCVVINGAEWDNELLSISLPSGNYTPPTPQVTTLNRIKGHYRHHLPTPYTLHPKHVHPHSPPSSSAASNTSPTSATKPNQAETCGSARVAVSGSNENSVKGSGMPCQEARRLRKQVRSVLTTIESELSMSWSAWKGFSRMLTTFGVGRGSSGCSQSGLGVRGLPRG